MVLSIAATSMALAAWIVFVIAIWWRHRVAGTAWLASALGFTILLRALRWLSTSGAVVLPPLVLDVLPVVISGCALIGTAMISVDLGRTRATLDRWAHAKTGGK